MYVTKRSQNILLSTIILRHERKSEGHEPNLDKEDYCASAHPLPFDFSTRRLRGLRERSRHCKRARCACGTSCFQNDHVAGRLLLNPAGLARERRAAELLRLQQALQCDADIGIGISAPTATDGNKEGKWTREQKGNARTRSYATSTISLAFPPGDQPGKGGIHDHSGFILGYHIKINRAVQGRAVSHTEPFRCVPAPAQM